MLVYYMGIIEGIVGMNINEFDFFYLGEVQQVVMY